MEKKKEERRNKDYLPCGYQEAKDSTFCPNSLQLKEDYLPCGYQEAKDSTFCPNSLQLKVLVLSLDITQHSGDTSPQN